MELTYTYPDGINSSHFKEICRMLNKGTSVEFNCGARSLQKEPTDKLKPAFKKNVDHWVGMVNDCYNEEYKTNIKLEYDYFSKNTWWKIHVYTPSVPDCNIKAKRFLSKDY